MESNYKRNRCLAYLIVISLTLPDMVTQAQSVNNRGTIAGLIVDGDGLPLGSVTITIHNAVDSSLRKAVISDDKGKFIFSQLPYGRYFIKVSMVGYNQKYSAVLTIDSLNDRIGVPVLQLQRSSSPMKEVIVSAQLPPIEMKLDKMIINVENSILRIGKTAYEILQSSPGISAGANGDFSIKGKPGAVVFIDDKPTYLSRDQLNTFLKGLSADEISKIEIISNPSARYDATGTGGIINIVRRKNRNNGITGNIYSEYTQGKYAQYYSRASLNYKKNAINAFLEYNFSKERYWNSNDTRSKFYNDTTRDLSLVIDRDAYGNYGSLRQSVRGGLIVEIDKKNNVGFEVNLLANKYTTLDFTSANRFMNAGSRLDSAAISGNAGSSRFNSITFDLNYRLVVDTSGSVLTANLDYSEFEIPDHKEYYTKYENKDGDVTRPLEYRQSNKSVEIGIRSAKIDYVRSFRNGKIEAGLKSSLVTNDNDIVYQNEVNSDWQNDPALSNNFKYKEQINAAYINFNRELKNKWSFQLGVRGEQTLSKADQVTSDSTINRKYFQLFPSAVIQKEWNKIHSVSLSYSRRITRPDYEALNPFHYYIDQFNYQIGNPYLRPAIANSLEFSYAFKGQLFASVNYSHTTAVITSVLSQTDSSHISYQSYQNLNTLDNGGLSISGTLRMASWWSVNSSAILFYDRYKSPLNNTQLDQGMLAFSFTQIHTFSLPSSWKAELNGFYQSTQQSGAFVVRPAYSVALGFQKLFFHEKLNLKININDLLNSYKTRSYEKFGNIDISLENRWQNRKAGISLTYNFGNNKLKLAEKGKIGIEEEQGRVNK